MSDKENVPHDIVELLIKEVTGTIKDLGGDIETCSTNIVALANKIDLANINDLDRKVEDVQRNITTINGDINESKKSSEKVEKALFKWLPIIFTIIGVVIAGIGWFTTMNSVSTMILESQETMKKIQQNNLMQFQQEIKNNNRTRPKKIFYKIKERIEVDERDEIIYKRIRDENKDALGNGYE